MEWLDHPFREKGGQHKLMLHFFAHKTYQQLSVPIINDKMTSPSPSPSQLSLDDSRLKHTEVSNSVPIDQAVLHNNNGSISGM